MFATALMVQALVTTGLAITLGAIATLFVMMQVTGRLDWGQATGDTRAPGGPAGSPPPGDWPPRAGAEADDEVPLDAALSGPKPVSF